MDSNTQILKKLFTADLRPAYYDNFQCLADKCEIDCCTGWDISFNRKDYLKIRQQKGSDLLNTAIKETLIRNTTTTNPDLYASLRLKEAGCPLLTENRLCRLQAECGYDALPRICKTYPRSNVYAPSGYYERSLSPSCEAVLELLWKLPEGIDFVSDPLPKKEVITKTTPVENLSLVSHFQDIRALCIGLLQDRRFPLRERILLMGIFLQKLTAEDADIPAWLEQTKQMLKHPDLAAITSPLFSAIPEQQQVLVLLQHTGLLLKMQQTESHRTLHGLGQKLLAQMVAQMDERDEKICVSIHTKKFADSKAAFTEIFGEREYFFENLVVSTFFYQLLPHCRTTESLWKSYVGFCNLYSLFRFMAICSYLEPAKEESSAKRNLFSHILYISRAMLHNPDRRTETTDEFFAYENTSLAHMAALLSI